MKCHAVTIFPLRAFSNPYQAGTYAHQAAQLSNRRRISGNLNSWALGEGTQLAGKGFPSHAAECSNGGKADSLIRPLSGRILKTADLGTMGKICQKSPTSDNPPDFRQQERGNFEKIRVIETVF